MADEFNSEKVQGAAADGAAVAGNPVLVAGSDGANAQNLLTDASGRIEVNAINAALPAGTNNIGDVDIVTGPTGASALEQQGNAADGAAAVGNPLQVAGKDGSNNIQALSTDTSGNLNVNVGTPTNPSIDHVTSPNLAPAATVDLDGTDLGGTTQQLAQISLWSSIPWKATISSVIDGTPTTQDIVGGQAGEPLLWTPPNKAYFNVAFAANAGFDGWRVTFLNRNDANGQNGDVYATFYRED
ncbi:MAG: hypothetical protein V3R83_09735 [Gammaproteobacteria bacterium]